jgi:glycosyltransferase involved in cell wall biosynthesis
MIGDGPLRNAAADLVRARGLEDDVRLLGHRERGEVWRWQCAADLFLNSSRVEGTPISVLEALGAGTPVASYSLAGIRAVVEATGGGSFTQNRAPAALAAAMAQTLATAGERDALASEARARFAIAPAAEAIEGVYAAIT